MELLLTLVVAVLVFALFWWLIQIVPFPAGVPPAVRTVLHILLIVAAIWWLWSRFLA